MIEVSLTVDRQRVIGEVHDHLYGANLEHIGSSMYGGVWAEMLRARKFAGHDQPYIGLSEGLAHQNPNFGVVVPWEAVNPHYHNVLYVHDNTTFYTGSQSQRITIQRTDGAPHGIRQSGLTLRGGQAYVLRLVLRGQGQPVSVALADARWKIPAAAPEWCTYEQTLVPAHDASDAALSIVFSGVGSLWIGCASLMPADNLDGFRPDVVAAIRRLKPAFLRWPGGNFASGYHWRAGLGDRDLRPSYYDPAWQVWESNDVGTIEFLRLAELVGAEPILTLNMGNGSVQEAVEWLLFCNAPADTPLGALRASLGRPQPLALKTWFVGNEQFGNWQVGHVDAETYAQRYLAFATALRAADTGLRLIAVGVPNDLYGHWNELLLTAAGHEIDALSVHYYSIRTERWAQPPSPETLYWPKVASACEVEAMLEQTLTLIERFSSPPVPLAFDEWNTFVAAVPPDFLEDYTIADALYAGGVMNACLRHANRITMSAAFNLINVMGNFRVTPTQIWETPTSLVIGLMTRLRGPLSVAVQVSSPTIATPGGGNLPAMPAVPLVDAAATYDPAGRCLYVYLVNRHPEMAAHVAVAGVVGSARLHIVSGNHPMALNTSEHPMAVHIQEAQSEGDDYLLLPPHSFTVAHFSQL